MTNRVAKGLTMYESDIPLNILRHDLDILYIMNVLNMTFGELAMQHFEHRYIVYPFSKFYISA